MENFNSIVILLDNAKRLTGEGGEYWMGRNIQNIFGYDKWDKFENVINRAMKACESAGINPGDHFLQTGKMVGIGSGAQRERGDYFLTRYACYLVAMNGDTSKPEVGIAQTYFAVQARKQEVQDRLTETERRIELRERVKNANRSLTSAAKRAGVQRYALFHDAGYQGLYEMGLTQIRVKKGIAPKENLLDRAGRTELAANEFRITQTEEKLVRDGIKKENLAIETHRNVGREVRNVIKKLGGTLPENLTPEESIKKLTGRKKKELENKTKLSS
jgi:DNA-damage-inducible protein D